jgi:hypothetical protein
MPSSAPGAPEVIGSLPYRIALAGGWIDQPFVSRHNPSPPGSMVVVAVHPDFRFMDYCGIGTSTRKVAQRIWGEQIPARPLPQLVRELYFEENRDAAAPSGSQDMVGLVYPGVSRIDYDFRHEGGIFPVHVESTIDAAVAEWVQGVINVLPVAQRPPGYDPLEVKNMDPAWVKRLGDCGRACFDAIVTRDLHGLQDSMNVCMAAWATLLPSTVRHRTVTVDLEGIMRHYQEIYGGAMYSGCGGGYLFVATDRDVPGSFRIRVKTS